MTIKYWKTFGLSTYQKEHGRWCVFKFCNSIGWIFYLGNHAVHVNISTRSPWYWKVMPGNIPEGHKGFVGGIEDGNGWRVLKRKSAIRTVLGL